MSKVVTPKDLSVKLRTALIEVFSTEETLADEIFGKEAARAQVAAQAVELIEKLHLATRAEWAKAEGTRAEVLWVAKDRAEAMRNKVALGKCLEASFLNELDKIDAALTV